MGDENIRIIGEKSNLEKAVGTTLTGKSLLVVWYVNGAPGAIRTPGPQIRSLMLYPAELRVHWSAAIRHGGKVVQGLICRWKLLAGRFPADCVHDRKLRRIGKQYAD